MARQLTETSDGQPDPVLTAGPSLLQSMWLRRYVLAVTAVVAFLIGFGLSSLQPPLYSATATVFLTDPSEAELFGRDAPDPERHVQQQASRMQSRSVFEGAAAALDGAVGVRELSRRVSIAADPTVGVIDVSASADDPETAARAANAVARSYEQASQRAGAALLESAAEVFDEQMASLRKEARRLRDRVNANPDDLAAQSSLEAVEAQLAALQIRLSELATEIAFYGSGVDSIEEARASAQPSSPKPPRDAALAAALGVALATAIVYWRAGSRSGERRDVGTLLDAPLLAQIPDFKEVGEDPSAMLFDPRVVEAYQFLVASVEYALIQAGGTSVLVTSAVPGEGKSLTALHLSRALASQGRDVVLIDSDIRSRGLTHLLEAREDPGLVELAQGSRLDAVVQLDGSDTLKFVPAGTLLQPPTGLLSTTAYRDALADTITSHEITVIDAEPLLTFADASAVAHQVAGILLVVDAQTSDEHLEKVAERLRFIPTPVLGYVVNRAPARRPSPPSRTRYERSHGGASRAGSTPQATNVPPRVHANGRRRSSRVPDDAGASRWDG